MSRHTKFTLLFLSIFIVLGMSFTTKYILPDHPSCAHSNISYNSNTLLSSLSAPVSEFGSFVKAKYDVNPYIFSHGKHWRDKQFKFKKKFKRSLPAFSGINVPSRIIEPVPFNIFLKTSYSKPHFLSHLHHFLFRLTPF